jgi:hypothetical protein
MTEDTTATPEGSGITETPNSEDLTRRLAEAAETGQTQAEREATAEFDPVTGSINGDGESLEDRANDAPATGQDDDGQLFILEEGRQVGLSTLVKRGTPVTYEFKLDGFAVPGAAGMSLIAFADPDRNMVVPGRAGKVETDPTYDGDGNVKKVSIRQHFKPKMVYDARTDAARKVMGPPTLEKAIAALLEDGVDYPAIRRLFNQTLTDAGG